MKSFFAALQTLTLPFGATTGRRIVLDGINGTIQIYDINGLLMARMGFADSIELFSRQANETLGADIQAAAIGTAANPARRAELILESPNLTGGAGGGTRSQLEMLSESFDGTIKTLIQYIANVHDFLPATANDPDIRLNSVSLPRGRTDFAENANNVVLSTTAGTYTAVVTGAAVALISGRRYRITKTGGDNLLIAGSVFATTDTWKEKVQVDIGAGFVDVKPGPWEIARAPVAQTFRYPILVGVATYVPGSNVTATFRTVAAKTSGAATVTSTMEATATNPHTILVEDIGT